MSPAQELIEQAKDLIQEGQDLLIKGGKAYDLSQWLTPPCYAQKYNLASSTIVISWIAEGIIPYDDVIQIEELSDLTLIKDKKYNG